MVGLGAIPGGTFSAAFAISANGLVVVGQSGSTAWPSGEAFIWTPSTGKRSLAQVLSNANLAGWHLTFALGISASGRVVTGYGVDPNGETQAWIANLGDLVSLNSHDFNGDGFSDIAWRDTSGNAGVWLVNGIQVTQAAAVGAVPTDWSIVGQRDFNGDGKADFLWRDTSGNVAMWFMNGT